MVILIDKYIGKLVKLVPAHSGTNCQFVTFIFGNLSVRTNNPVITPLLIDTNNMVPDGSHHNSHQLWIQPIPPLPDTIVHLVLFRGGVESFMVTGSNHFIEFNRK